MSPEALDGKRSIQTDVWSVGVNLYQFLTGTLPFPQKEPSVLFPAIIMREFAPLPDSIPQSLKNVVAKALAKLPENRFKTAGEMRKDLRRVLRAEFFIPLNYEGNSDLKEIPLAEYNNHIEAVEGKPEKISSKILETETSVRPISNELLIELSKSGISYKGSRPSVYLHSPEIRGLKLGMSFEELEHCFEIKITRRPDKLGCLSLTFDFDYPYGSYCRFTTFSSEKIIDKDIPFNKIIIKKYSGYRATHFRFLDEYVCEIFFELDSTIKWNRTEELCQMVSKQLNLSTSWNNWLGSTKYISTQFFDIFALVFRQQATLKFVSLEQQKEIKNRQRNLELGLEAVIKNEPVKDNDFLL